MEHPHALRRPGEVVVDVLTCGVCQTDMHYQVGGVSDDFPFLLGHEATGRVAAIGEGVTDIAVGDEVITNGGIAGVVRNIGDSFITVEVANGVEIRVQKGAVGNVLPKGTLKSA